MTDDYTRRRQEAHDYFSIARDLSSYFPPEHIARHYGLAAVCMSMASNTEHGLTKDDSSFFAVVVDRAVTFSNIANRIKPGSGFDERTHTWLIQSMKNALLNAYVPEGAHQEFDIPELPGGLDELVSELKSGLPVLQDELGQQGF